MLDLDLGFISIGRIAMHGLRPARNARLDDMTVVVERNLFFKLVHKYLLLRARANQGHFAPDDVEELGQLVDASLADELANTGDAHVAGLGELGTILFGVAAHAAELVNGEFLAKLADPFLQEQHGAFAFQLDGDAGDDHDGQHDRHGKQHQRGFPDALEDAVGFRGQQGAQIVLVHVADLDAAGQRLLDLADVVDRYVLERALRQEFLPFIGQCRGMQVSDYAVNPLCRQRGRVHADPVGSRDAFHDVCTANWIVGEVERLVLFKVLVVQIDQQHAEQEAQPQVHHRVRQAGEENKDQGQAVPGHHDGGDGDQRAVTRKARYQPHGNEGCRSKQEGDGDADFQQQRAGCIAQFEERDQPLGHDNAEKDYGEVSQKCEHEISGRN